MTTAMSPAFTLLAASLQWQSIDDGVMGGVSSSRWSVTPAGILNFSGTVSLANNGGFASIRSAPGAFDLSAHPGMVLRVRGDGKRYLVNLKTDATFDGAQYRAAFETRAGIWTDVLLPFETFESRFRGRPVADVPVLDPGRVVSFGLMIADRQAGAFALEVDTISGALAAPPR
jgi:Complex I intermediate-associated protein 30 (CIA30)